MRESAKHAKSAVVFDLAPGRLRAHLFDECEGAFRFLARGESSLLGIASESVAEGALAALADLELITGRTLVLRSSPLTPCGPDGSGVDALLATCAPPGRLQVAIIGTDAGLAKEAAARAVETAGHLVAYATSLDDDKSCSATGLYEIVRRVWSAEPDVVLIAARPDPRTDKLLVQLGAALGTSSLEGESTPLLLISGSAGARESLDQGLKGRLLARPVAELLPGPNQENLEPCKAALATWHAGKWCECLPDMQRLESWLAARPVARDVASVLALRFLAATFVAPAWLLDCGAQDVYVGTAGADGAAYCRLLRSAGADDCLPWLPAEAPTAGMPEALLHHHWRPGTVAGSPGEALWRQSLIRAVCQSLYADPRQPLPLVPPTTAAGHAVLSGGSDCLGSDGEAALLLLDALRPAGIGHLHWDHLAVLPALGALGELVPQLAVDVLASDVLRPLALFVAPTGQVRSGGDAVSIDITFADKETMRLEVAASEIEQVAVPRGEQVSVRVRTAGAFDLGAGRGKQITLELASLPLGIVVDARGRPLPQMTEAERRRSAMDSRVRLGCEPVEVTVP
ncbi:MAG: glutamate mutase L [Chloroflexota bacterium]